MTLCVGYAANNPVTITWRADGRILSRMEDRVRQSETSLRLGRSWLKEHPDSKYKVTVLDQEMRRESAVNPVRSSCKITINLDP